MYNDASLALIPSAVGDGVVYNARPVEALGAELVTNGDFLGVADGTDVVTLSGWLAYGTVTSRDIEGEKLKLVTTGGNTGAALVVSTTVGRPYKLRCSATGDTGTGGIHVDSIGNADTSAETSYTFTAIASSTIIYLRAGSNSGGTIYYDNISVKEVLTSAQDFDFTRASEATRVLSGGRIEKVRTNVLTYSNDFSNVIWLKTSVTLTGGQADKDGGSNAWKFESQGAASFIQQLASNSGVYTRSFYAKAGNVNWVSINSGGSQKAFFDLQNGVVGTTSAGVVDANIESVGNGWYRCSVVINSQNDFYLFVANTDNSSITSAGEYIYIQDAQLEQGLAATEYIATTTTSVSVGSVNDMPRLDWSGGCPALLLEPSRTNSLTHSEAFSQWTLEGSASLTSNAIASPDGYINAAKLIAGASSARQSTKLANTSTGDLAYSVYAKKGEYSVIQLTDAENGAMYANFDLDAGAIGDYEQTTPIIESVGSGWYRCIMNYTSGNNVNAMRISIAESPTQIRLVEFAGNGSDGVYIYGAQLELGNYSTSLIPTYGTATTRAADACSKTGISSLIGQTEGTIFLDFELQTSSDDIVLMNLYQSSATVNSFYFYVTTSNLLFAYCHNTSTQADINGGTIALGRHKIAFSYASNDLALYIDGELAGVDLSSTIPTCDAIRLNDYEPTQNYLEKTEINQALLFTTRLSDTELEKLTTL
jgi:hypothetical protein